MITTSKFLPLNALWERLDAAVPRMNNYMMNNLLGYLDETLIWSLHGSLRVALWTRMDIESNDGSA